MSEPYVVARADDVPPGTRVCVSVRGRSVVIFNVEGEYFAILNRCPHEGAPLSEGVLVGLMTSDRPGEYSYSRPGEFLRCPWHGWEFDIRTGRSYCNPTKTRARTFDTTVRSGSELVKGPFSVEKFDVAIDRNYIVVTM